ncbi:UDP-N-acetylmuramoyl-tripeptide--D-alanyl-D-alanine ligase [Sinobaca qinghaiensis]|uniref:UDP-N-acetylmuramoyl-tripeptide--D-alanyl-D-alanine ligase n=2 Tax=Sinobaca TaxID=342943 RepID=A0A419V4Y8_9BACL|nr:UDP-N-acetylmuramoyl-tripeptide--D-alanyl-D-alanine ligase [Sinobaca qinghaiensis]RKD73580.1 UDP-N-acetylmuramoyl-tripeptide--D-alanyl-D-alanine ligase [Sinobaca qinghaiensis]
MISLLILLFIIAWGYYTLRLVKRSTHMLQLNSYRNERIWKWMKEHQDRVFPIRSFWPLLALLPLFAGNVWLALTIGIILYGFNVLMMQETTEKKKLVVTKRVRRLFITVTLLYAAVIIIGLSLSAGIDGSYFWLIALAILTNIFVYFMVMTANLINMPIERQINQHFFNDAERIIKEMPNLETVGVTGSYGKTSTKHVLEAVLSSQFNVLMTPESYNTRMGITLTIRNMLKPYHEIFIAEMGAKQEHDIQAVCDLVHQKYGIITAIGEQHLETFKTLDTIKKTKFEIVESLPNDGTAFLNKDDENIMSYKQRNQVRTMYYGIDAEDLHFRAENIAFSSKGSTFTIMKYDGSSVDVETKLLGRHNIYNILAAVAIGSEKGIPLEKMARAVKKLQPVEHRLELKKPQGNITIIDDAFNSNPVGSRMALEVLGQMPEYKMLITPGMIELGDKEYDLNKAFAEYAADVCDFIILVGKKQTKPMQDGLLEKEFPEEKYYVAADLQDALNKMHEKAVQKSIVLLENDLPDTFNE